LESMLEILQQFYIQMDSELWECLTVCKALSHANAKGKGIDSEGWAFRML